MRRTVILFLLLSAAVAQEPPPRDTADTLLAKSDVLIRANRLKEALEVLERVRKLAPDEVRAPYLMAECELNLGLRDNDPDAIERAKALLLAAEKVDDTFGPSAWLWGAIGFETKDYAMAVQGFRGSLTRGFRPRASRASLAHALFRRGLEVAEEERANLALAVSLFEEAQQRFEALSKDLRFRAEERKDFWEHWLLCKANLAALNQQAGNYPLAEKYLKSLIELEPEQAGHHYNLGLLYGESRQWDKALAQYRKALELEPDFLEPHLKIGYILSQQGKPKEAERHFRIYVKANPDAWFGHYYLGEFLAGEERLDEAVVHLERCVEIDQQSFAAIRLLSRTLRQAGRIEEAEKWNLLYQALDAESDDGFAPEPEKTRVEPK